MELNTFECSGSCQGLSFAKTRDSNQYCSEANEDGIAQIYVDSLSNSSLKLGTKAHPFKFLQSVWALLSENRDSKILIEIYLKENNIYKMEKGSASFINLERVFISSYKENFDETSVKPEIMIEDLSNFDYFTTLNEFHAISELDISPDFLRDLSISE